MSMFLEKVRLSWKSSFSDKRFRNSFIAGFIVLLILLSLLPVFYPHIESRKGIVLNDWVLNLLTPHDVSVPIFMIIWGAGVMGIYRTLTKPEIFLQFIYAYIFFVITRSICLVLVPLDPPVGIVELKDPLTNIFYGGKFMTKDLFYSGHTCAVVLICMLLEKKADRLILIPAAFTLAILLLVQHVHYTIDILAAVLFSVICLKSGNAILKKSLSFAAN